MNFIVWLAILAGISLLTSLILIALTSGAEFYTDDEVNWMNMELYDKQLAEATKIDKTKLHIVPLAEAEPDFVYVEIDIPATSKRDKSGKFVKKTTVLPTDYYGAMHNNTVEPNSMN